MQFPVPKKKKKILLSFLFFFFPGQLIYSLWSPKIFPHLGNLPTRVKPDDFAPPTPIYDTLSISLTW